MSETSEESSRGDLVVVGLVVSLLAFMFLIYAIGASYLRGEDWLVLVIPAARLTHSASMGLAGFCAVDAWRKGRTGWWLYVLAAPVPLLQWAVVVYWLTSGRQASRAVGRWTI